MSYQVLARKWRPKSFREMAGQQHVLQALVNALDHNRLHHAYLFTGTRGVGKTTLARILAKCLNCEIGVSSVPCGTCSSCMEINEGRFVDLIEIDAASHTGVDDVRELIDNAQYMPSRGRFKVYLIDEVHMLSKAAFNALLKTLEEPPAHVKFLLATTDPQKLPATILSRCLQFSLKNLGPDLIVTYLKQILDKEVIAYEEPALWQLGRAADGSMRDALSLTDQAISFGNGKLTERDVGSMLGSIHQQLIINLLKALAQQNAKTLLEAIDQLAENNPDYSTALNEVASLLHKIAILQAVPDATLQGEENITVQKDFARQISSEDVQLFYQIAITGLRDLPLAPDPRAGFEMALLRMLAFKPQGVPQLPKSSATSAARNPPVPQGVGASPKKPEPAPAASVPVTSISASPATSIALPHISPDNWYQLFNLLPLSGVIQNTAAHCVLDSVTLDNQACSLHFTLDDTRSSLFNQSHQERLSTTLTQHFQTPVTAFISIGSVNRETPAVIRQRLQAERLQKAQQAFEADKDVQVLLTHFNGKIVTHSVKPENH